MNIDQGMTVIDVGYAGVIGADRILDGRAPYGAMPVTDGLYRSPARGQGADGEIRERIQSNGRAASRRTRAATRTGPSPTSPTCRPCSRSAGAAAGTSSAAHATSIAFDLLALAALALIGRRLGGSRLAATLAFGWAAYPFTAYALMSNTNDAIMPASAPPGLLAGVVPDRPRSCHRAGLLDEARVTDPRAAVADLPQRLTGSWRATRRPRRRSRRSRCSCSSCRSSTPYAVWDRTLGSSSGATSPFSIWGWGQYHAAGSRTWSSPRRSSRSA